MKLPAPLFALLAAIATATSPAPTLASGDASIVSYTPAYLPRHKLADYLHGQLGVLDPTYFRRYLFFAYRQLRGKPFSDDDLAELTTNFGPGFPDDEPHARWNELAYPGEFHPGDDYRQIEAGTQTTFIYNCPSDAYSRALSTYAERAATYGTGSQPLARWLDAQRMVFANCSGGTSIPTPLPADALQLERQDRSYQIAAATFYAAKYSEAATRFEDIANDRTSPWSKLGAYLAARAYVRMGSIATTPEAARAAYTKAQGRLDAVLADPLLEDVHASAAGLKEWVALRRDPEPTRVALEQRLLTSQSSRGVFDDLTDYQWVLDQIEARADREHKSPADLISRDGGLTDWIFTVQEGRESTEFAPRDRAKALAHALAQRTKEGGEDAWTVAALLLASTPGQLPAGLFSAVGNWPATHPGYATARLRLLALREAALPGLSADRQEAERTAIVTAAKDLLTHRAFFADGRNALRQLILRHTDRVEDLEQSVLLEDLDEITLYRFGEPGESASTPTPPRSILWAEGEYLINTGLPLSSLETLIVRKNLAPRLATNLVVAAWTRAVALDDHPRALRLTPYLAEAVPVLKPALATYTAASAEEQRFAAADILIRHPALAATVDLDHDRATLVASGQFAPSNWWCPSPRDAKAPFRLPSRLLTQNERAAAARERAALAAASNGTNHLARLILARAESHPADPRIPEDLHRMVAATRGGCIDKNTPALSKQMFRVLHGKYKNNEWSKRTRVHY